MSRLAAIVAIAALLVAGLVTGGCTSPQRTAPATPSSPSSSPPPSAASGAPLPDWPTYHRSADRAGAAPDTPRPGRLSAAWARELDGAVYAAPLVVGGRVIAATENDTVYALEARTGRVIWRRHVGTPVPLSGLPCGNVDPLGITGTPVYDPATRRVFAVAEVRAGGRVRHDLVGLALADGHLDVRRAVDPPDQDPLPMQQRAALTLVADRVYVAYGGLYGDCGDYHGHVVGARTDGSGALTAYRLPTPREGGIWAAAGPVTTRDARLLVSVGNGASTSSFDGTDSVLALSTPELRRLSYFAPRTWREDNAADADLGSMSPVLMADDRVVIAGKSGTVYLLRGPDSLGGVGGELTTLDGCEAYGGAAVDGSTAYLPCDAGLRRLTVSGDGLRWDWQASGVSGSPVLGGGAVWALDTDHGDLVALDSAAGRELARRHVGPVTRFASPALSGALAFVGTQRGIVASRVSPAG